MPEIYSTPTHCPGFSSFKNLKAFSCKCPECGEEKEIFSDEFDKPHVCGKCKKPINFTQCSLEGAAGPGDDPR